MAPGSTLIIGCGYLGRRAAAAWREEGRMVYAFTRNRAEVLKETGFTPIPGDVTDPSTLKNLPQVETVLYAVGLDRSAGKSMRAVYVDGLANVLDALPSPAKFLYVSSSSVYGQSNGEWVTEESPTEPAEESGKVVREAEQLLQKRMPTAVVLRFAGIYGPGRLLRESAVRAGEPLIGDADKWLNLIHVNDGVRAVLAAEAKAASRRGIQHCGWRTGFAARLLFRIGPSAERPARPVRAGAERPRGNASAGIERKGERGSWV